MYITLSLIGEHSLMAKQPISWKNKNISSDNVCENTSVILVALMWWLIKLRIELKVFYFILSLVILVQFSEFKLLLNHFKSSFNLVMCINLNTTITTCTASL